MSVATARLTLHPVDEDEARRIQTLAPGPDDHWAADYPSDGDLAAVGAYLDDAERHGEQRPFGYYRVTRRSDGLAIGGIGFKGPPHDGVDEVGYGFARSAQGRGYATEALLAMVDLAGTLGVRTLQADTDVDNLASQRVLEKAGFRLTRSTADAHYFETDTERSDISRDTARETPIPYPSASDGRQGMAL